MQPKNEGCIKNLYSDTPSRNKRFIKDVCVNLRIETKKTKRE